MANEYENAVELMTSEELTPEEADIVEKTESIIRQMKKANNAWDISVKGRQAKRLAIAAIHTKNGMYARVPLICRGEGCPYAQQCTLLPYDMAPEGEYCAVELAQIDMRAMGYTQDIDYDTASFTDKTLMSELVTLDIMLERCKALMAKEATPVVDIAVGTDSEGREIRQPSVSKAWEAYEKISKKRDATYQLLMMTRKDRKTESGDKEAKTVSDAFRDIIAEAKIEE